MNGWNLFEIELRPFNFFVAYINSVYTRTVLNKYYACYIYLLLPIYYILCNVIAWLEETLIKLISEGWKVFDVQSIL